MARAGPRTVRRCSEEFKLTAVRLTQQPGIQVQTVAAALATLGALPLALEQGCAVRRATIYLPHLCGEA